MKLDPAKWGEIHWTEACPLPLQTKVARKKNFESMQGKSNWAGQSFEFHTKLHFNLFLMLKQNNEIQKLEAVWNKINS